MYEYRCKILRVVDGDTVDVDIDLGFGMWMHKERVRMMGIDTPESRTRDKVEKKFGLASKQFVKDIMPVGSKQVLKTQIDRSGEDKKGKFGRWLGTLWTLKEESPSFENSYNKQMINEGLAKEYWGGKRK